MKIIECLILGKNQNQELCEDGIFINEHFIAVIDGVTAKGKHLWNGATSGLHAKNIIINYLKDAPYNINATELLNNLNRLLMKEFINYKVEDDEREYLRASIIIFSNYFKEIWSFGDCQCMINNQTYIHSKKIDYLNSEMRTMAIKSFLKMGTKVEELLYNDRGRDLILPFLEMQLIFENTDDDLGYAVLNGKQINMKLFKSYKVKAGDLVVLASDGYPKLFRTLEESEEYLKMIITEDPLCFSLYKSTKGLLIGQNSFDDRAYIRFLI